MIWTHTGVALLAAGAAFAGGWQARAWKAGADERDRLAVAIADDARRARQTDAAAESHESFKAAQDARQRAHQPEIDRVASLPAHRRVCLSDDGLRLIAAAIGARAAREPAPAVRAASGPG